MEKVIPRNPKYSDVEATVDTGASMSRYLKKMEEFRENFRMRDDEIFPRMKLSTFVQLILQINESLESAKRIQTFKNDGIKQDVDENSHTNDSEYADSNRPPGTARSTLQDLIHGVGETDKPLPNGKSHFDLSNKPVEPVIFESPYLLLDVRERDEFDQCHIITACSYPSAMLSRCINYETADMLAFRNKPGRIIVVYDEDERIAPRAVTTLVQRGYSNIYLLSGGLKVAWKYFPEGLLIGQMPLTIRQSLKSRPRERNLSANSLLSRIQSASSIASSRSSIISSATSNASNRTSRTLPITIYCPIGSRFNSDGNEEFSAEDIMKLIFSLEKGFDSGNSVRSGYANSTASSVRHSSSLRGCNSATVRKPFK